jgi:tripartite-type tricarboxylate transporter receptor subunit TctC
LESKLTKGALSMKLRSFFIEGVILGLLVLPFHAFAATSFFEGKTVRFIVGTAPGGGYDTYTRLLARHFAKYVPGNPTIVVDNMVGAGGQISANHLYKVAKPDGLTIGHFVGGLFLQQLLGRPGVEFDALKFEYIGVPVQDTTVVAISKSAGISSIEQWKEAKAPVKFGGIAPGDSTYNTPKIIEAALGLPMQLVMGYKGGAPIKLAMEGGEIQATCLAWESLKATWRKEVESGEVLILVQAVAKPHADLPKVPLLINNAKTDEARKMIQVGIHNAGATARPYVLPPGTPKDRVKVLRAAFLQTTKDPEFLAEAKKANLEINPLSGEDLEREIKEIFQLDSALVARLKEILR